MDVVRYEILMACEGAVTLDDICWKAKLSNRPWAKEHVELLVKAGFLRESKRKDASSLYQITDKGHYFRPYLADLIKAKQSNNPDCKRV